MTDAARRFPWDPIPEPTGPELRDQALARVEEHAAPDWIAVAWQALGDGYDLAHFTAAGPGVPALGPQRPDVSSRRAIRASSALRATD